MFWICCLLLVCQQAEAEKLPQEKYVAIADKQPIDNFAYRRFFVVDKLGRKVTFYLSKPDEPQSDTKLPLVVCIQGSGSQSVFLEVDTPNGKRIVSGGVEAVVSRNFKNRVRTLVVEKPGITFLEQPKRPGSSEEGSAEFNRQFTLKNWTEAICASVKAATQFDEIDSSKILVIGHSEGGQVACEVAAALPEVTHVAVMAGGGPTQLFDFIRMARDGTMFDPNATSEERVAALLDGWKKVLANPKAHDQFFWGHAHLRWRTFLKSSPIEAILRCKAKVFIAQGSQDKNSLPAGAEAMYAELLARGRPCEYRWIEGANHGFMTKDDKTGEGWKKTNSEAIDWFLNDGT